MTDTRKTCPARKRPRRAWFAAVSLMLAAVAGCSIQREVYHFAVVDLDAKRPRLKFYRVRVKADSSLTKTSYQAGFYDVDALHGLLGQVSTSSKETPSSGGYRVYQQKDGQWIAADKNQRFAILYGANADAIANQISAFATSKETGEAMGSLIAALAVRGADYEKAILANRKASDAKKEAGALAKALREEAKKLEVPSDVDADDVRRALEKAIYEAKKSAVAAGAK